MFLLLIYWPVGIQHGDGLLPMAVLLLCLLQHHVVEHSRDVNLDCRTRQKKEYSWCINDLSISLSISYELKKSLDMFSMFGFEAIYRQALIYFWDICCFSCLRYGSCVPRIWECDGHVLGLCDTLSWLRALHGQDSRHLAWRGLCGSSLPSLPV